MAPMNQRGAATEGRPYRPSNELSMPTPNLTGKTIIVTGANAGIGKETALGLAKLDATIIMLCRDRDRGESALREIKQKSGNSKIDLMICDLASQESIEQVANEFKQHHDRLD